MFTQRHLFYEAKDPFNRHSKLLPLCLILRETNQVVKEFWLTVANGTLALAFENWISNSNGKC